MYFCTTSEYRVISRDRIGILWLYFCSCSLFNKQNTNFCVDEGVYFQMICVMVLHITLLFYSKLNSCKFFKSVFVTLAIGKIIYKGRKRSKLKMVCSYVFFCS